jgi:hypothetical protein
VIPPSGTANLVINSSFILVRGKQAKFSVSGTAWDKKVTIYLRRCDFVVLANCPSTDPAAAAVPMFPLCVWQALCVWQGPSAACLPACLFVTMLCISYAAYAA